MTYSLTISSKTDQLISQTDTVYLMEQMISSFRRRSFDINRVSRIDIARCVPWAIRRSCAYLIIGMDVLMEIGFSIATIITKSEEQLKPNKLIVRAVSWKS